MIQDSLVPEFVRGEEVVVIDKEGVEQHRGPLLGIAKSHFNNLEFTIGNETLSIYAGFRMSRFVLSAEKFDQYLKAQETRDFSDVADKYVSYAKDAFTQKEQDRVDQLINELADIARGASERAYQARGQKGASPESFQGMWGNHDLTRETIQKSVRESVAFRLGLNYDRVYQELSSLEQEDSVIYIGNGKPVPQKALKNGTKSN